jgi:preprotein translocase subunit SecG
MAANFGAANQTMGVRQTSDFLEKFTWAMIAAVVIFTLLSVVFAGKGDKVAESTKTATSEVEQAMKDLGIESAEAEEMTEFAAEADANTTTEEVATETEAETQE